MPHSQIQIEGAYSNTHLPQKRSPETPKPCPTDVSQRSVWPVLSFDLLLRQTFPSLLFCHWSLDEVCLVQAEVRVWLDHSYLTIYHEFGHQKQSCVSKLLLKRETTRTLSIQKRDNLYTFYSKERQPVHFLFKRETTVHFLYSCIKVYILKHRNANGLQQENDKKTD